MTTLFENGRFWLVDSVTFTKIETYPSFATIKEAEQAAGSQLEKDFIPSWI